MGKSKRRGNFIPPKRINEVVTDRKFNKLSEEIEENRKKIEHHKEVMSSVIESYDKHVEYLANFARHNMKNSVQSMDSILNTIDLRDLTEENWGSLKTCLEEIRSSIENFSKLVPYSSGDSFKLRDLIYAAELLTRPELEKNKIKFEFTYSKKESTEIYQPFQGLLQVVNNLIINAIKSLSGNETLNFCLKGSIQKEVCVIQVFDSGTIIDQETSEKIFNYGFSKTGGSGIGLFYAKYVCDQVNGSIELNNVQEGLYTKEFIFKFPIKSDNP